MNKLNKWLSVIAFLLWYGFLILVIIADIFNMGIGHVDIWLVVAFCIFVPFATIEFYSVFFYKGDENNENQD